VVSPLPHLRKEAQYSSKITPCDDTTLDFVRPTARGTTVFGVTFWLVTL
jgi:hypothetical protein